MSIRTVNNRVYDAESDSTPEVTAKFIKRFSKLKTLKRQIHIRARVRREYLAGGPVVRDVVDRIHLK